MIDLSSMIRNSKTRVTEFVVKPLEFNDGVTLSVQASRYHYCIPRDNLGPWTHFECGYPSAWLPELAPYAETPDTTETVFALVPEEVILKIIEKHGGLK
jgi:hypothetical protein